MIIFAVALRVLKVYTVHLKVRLDGASFRAPVHATLHQLMYASLCKSSASLAACLLLFKRY